MWSRQLDHQRCVWTVKDSIVGASAALAASDLPVTNNERTCSVAVVGKPDHKEGRGQLTQSQQSSDACWLTLHSMMGRETQHR